MADDLGMDVFQPVVGEPELVVPHHRAVLQDHMRGAAGVVAEARQRQLLGDDIAAEDRAALQHQAAVAGLGQIGRGHQAVVPRARDDDVETVGHSVHSHACGATRVVRSLAMKANVGWAKPRKRRAHVVVSARRRGPGADAPWPTLRTATAANSEFK